ncbi:MAG: putative bifunctional diguanylate cyclase/phosphodiesterase [Acidimicrobiales bacterium]
MSRRYKECNTAFVALRTVVQWLELGVFVLIGLVAVMQWRRQRGAAAAWLARAFALVAVVVVAGRFIGSGGTGAAIEWLTKALIVALALFPYCLYRFSRAFGRASRGDEIAAGSVTAALILATLAAPKFFQAGQALPTWAELYLLLFIVEWTVLSVMAVTRLWHAGQQQPTVARRRMRTLGSAAAVLNVAFLISWTSGNAKTGNAVVASQAVTLLATMLFLAGFAPPRFLRAVWRRREVAALRRAEEDLMAAETAERVAAIVLPHATEVVGARSAILTGVDGSVQATHGAGEDQARTIADRLARASVGSRETICVDDLIAIRLGGGWLALTTTESTPFFGPEDMGALQTLVHLAGLALERAELFDRERTDRMALAAQQRQLAEAQRTAQLGSFTWDVQSGRVKWSDEMGHVLGFALDDVDDVRVALGAAVHPDDRDRTLHEWEAIMSTALPSNHEYRIVWPSGETRWLQERSRPVIVDGTVVSWSGTVQDITERKAAEAVISFQANHDALTQLPNRARFLECLTDALDRCRRADRPGGVAVLFLDLDRFKWLNDSLGHAAGDRVLTELARRLVSVTRPSDTVSRFGGDEFVLLCEGVGETEATNLANRVVAALRKPVTTGREETTVTASIGIALAPASGAGHTPETLVRDADAAMYQAKDSGRDQIRVFDPSTHLLAVARHEMENALRGGIQRDEFVVHYQPEVNLATGAIVGVEALVRWNHPLRGLLAPGEFISVAEETGLIVPLGAAVLREACKVMAAWQKDDPRRSTMSVSVNLAARQLLVDDLVDVVADALSTSGLRPELLCLEITESVLLEDSGASARALNRLKSLGVRIAVDDFGTGFSSLTYLKRFPVDILKIDASFVDGLIRSREDRAIVASVIDLAHAFGLVTIAEGVETPEQLAELQALGCEQGQGYHWSRPLAPEDADGWIAAYLTDPSDGPEPGRLRPLAAGPSRHGRMTLLHGEAGRRTGGIRDAERTNPLMAES